LIINLFIEKLNDEILCLKAIQMLSKVITILVLILYTSKIFCMDKGELRNRLIKVSSKNGEVIYKIETMVDEKLDELFFDINCFLQKGEFSEAKELLESFCKQFVDNMKLVHRKQNNLTNLKELQSIFESKSQLLLDNFESNILLARLGSEDGVKSSVTILASSLAMQGVTSGESGFVLLAFAIAIAACCNPIFFFSLCTISTYFYIDNYLENNPEAILLFWLTLSFIFAGCLKKVNHHRSERNISLNEIKKIIVEFQEILTQKIDLETKCKQLIHESE
jgi:hypothetical protein